MPRGRRRTQYTRDNSGRFASTPGGGKRATPAAIRKAAKPTGSLKARSSLKKSKSKLSASSSPQQKGAVTRAQKAARLAIESSRTSISARPIQGTIGKNKRSRAKVQSRIKPTIQDRIMTALKRGPNEKAAKRFGPVPVPPPKPKNRTISAKKVDAANKIVTSPRRTFSDIEKAYAEIKSQPSKFRSDKKIREELARRGFDLRKYSSDNTYQGGLIKVAAKLREKVAPKLGIKKDKTITMNTTEREQLEKIVRQRIKTLSKTGELSKKRWVK